MALGASDDDVCDIAEFGLCNCSGCGRRFSSRLYQSEFSYVI